MYREGTGKVQGRYREGTGNSPKISPSYTNKVPAVISQGRYREGSQPHLSGKSARRHQSRVAEILREV
jgi:hypothetical protein